MKKKNNYNTNVKRKETFSEKYAVVLCVIISNINLVTRSSER